jgi:hypothetical protein
MEVGGQQECHEADNSHMCGGVDSCSSAGECTAPPRRPVCDAKTDKCRVFIRTVAQASYWHDKCIPYMTSLTEVVGVMLTFLEQNPQYVNEPATNVLLTAIHMKWPCNK